jgi:hypothetical protein
MNMKTFQITALAFALVMSAATDTITGRWESKPSVNGNTTGVLFKPDNSFEGFINKKPFVTGTYSMKGDTCTLVDNGCDGKQAIYQVIFFSNSDSMRFKAISDSCTGRKNGMEQLVLGRVK